MDQNGHMDRVHLVSTGQQCAWHDCFHLSIIDLHLLEYFPDYTLHYSGKLYTHTHKPGYYLPRLLILDLNS